ncbi:hypothetical protein AX15_005401 [Amanita polypyramis BW_CC]|nr:hypothetical protein AX15_005401 [Amanita polypyramis BW_CC]
MHESKPRYRKNAEHTTEDIIQLEEDNSDCERAKDMWRRSPSPEETFSEAEGANSDGEWPLEIIDEDITHYGEVKYKVKWGNWKRMDGTNTTWDNSLIPARIQGEWDRAQEKRRLRKARKSSEIRIPGTIDITDMLTFTRSEALQEKLEMYGSFTLNQRLMMATESSPTTSRERNQHMAIKAGNSSPRHEINAYLLKSSRPPSQSSSTLSSDAKITSAELHSPLTKSQKKGRRMVMSPDLDSISREATLEPDEDMRKLKRVKYDREDLAKVKQTFRPRVVRLEGLYEDKTEDLTFSSMGTKHQEVKKRYSTRYVASKFFRLSNWMVDSRDKLAAQWTEIAKVAGAAQITITNGVDDEELPKLLPGFEYLETGYKYSENVPKAEELEDSLFLRCSCGRCSDPRKCECQLVSDLMDEKGIKIIAYDAKGLFAISVTPGLQVIECNKYCKCDILCPNRVSQRPRKIPIDIFKTVDRGWGARPLCNVQKGTVLGIYTGKLMRRTEAEALNRGERGFCFDLDGQENPFEDEHCRIQAYTVDSRTCGNWTRFINHSCSPNVQVYQAVHSTIPEMNTPFIVFCALKDIPSRREFTIDYDPCASDIELVDSSARKKRGRPRKRKQKSVPDGCILCRCGEQTCRQWVRVLS